MDNLKKKVVWTAVVAGSVMLASCGGDSSSSSSSSGLSVSVKDLEYTGLETAATIDADNYLEIAAAAHGVTLGLMTEDYIGYYGTPYAASVSGSTVTAKQASQVFDALQKDLLQKLAEQEGSQTEAPSAVLSTSTQTDDYQYEYTVEGECGGSVSMVSDGEYTYSYSEDEDATPEIDTRLETEGEDVEISYNDYCVYLDDDVTEVVVNGSGEIEYNYLEERDYVADTYHVENGYEGISSVDAVIGEASFSLGMTYQYEYMYDSAYDSDSGNYLYDPDTYVRERKSNYAVSSPAGTGYYTYTESCSVDEADYSSTDCEDAELLEVDGVTYKIDGYAENDDGVNIDIYLADYGYVSVDDGTSYPVLCADGSGIESGQLTINSGEITIDYSSCTSATVTYDGVGEIIEQ